MAKTFPRLIHVSRAYDRNSTDSWLQVHESGVSDFEEPMACAVYKLVTVGRVRIVKTFEKGK